jgi:hypothetical protein
MSKTSTRNSSLRSKGYSLSNRFRLLVPDKPSLFVRPNRNSTSSAIHMRQHSALQMNLTETPAPVKVVYTRRGGSSDVKGFVLNCPDSKPRTVAVKVFRTLSSDYWKAPKTVKHRLSTKIIRARAPSRPARNSDFGVSGLRPNHAKMELQPILHRMRRRRLEVNMSAMMLTTVGTETEDLSACNGSI